MSGARWLSHKVTITDAKRKDTIFGGNLLAVRAKCSCGAELVDEASEDLGHIVRYNVRRAAQDHIIQAEIKEIGFSKLSLEEINELISDQSSN